MNPEEYANPFREAGTSPPKPVVSDDNLHPIPYAYPAGETQAVSKISLFERMLSPQSLQWMMISGGGLLVIGFVVWLWSIGLFENPLVGAGALGAGTLGVLGAGLWLYQQTRFKLAGRGLTLLASLVLPLNLWFYDFQGLITLDEGGHLWIPALACCIIYALVARVTRDSMFVYTLVGGVVLTGLLMLANPTFGALWAVMPTCTFLVALGAICVVADRWFQEPDGAFSRDQFGLAFFRAGQITMLGGLSVLMGGFVNAFLSESLSSSVDVTRLFADSGEKVWAIAVLILATVTFAYSHLSRPNGFVFATLAIATTAWAGLIALNLLAIPITFNLFLVFVAVMVIGINGFQYFASRNEETDERLSNDPVTRTLIPVAAGALMFLGVLQSVCGLVDPAAFMNGTLIFQMFATVVACWSVPKAWTGHKAAATEDSNVLAGLSVHAGAIGLVFALVVSAFFSLGLSMEISLLIGLSAPLALAVAGQVFSAAKLTDVNRALSLRMNLSSGSAASAVFLLSANMFFSGQIVFATWMNVLIMGVLSALYFNVSRIDSRFTIIPGCLTSLIAAIQIAALLNITSAYTLILAVSISGLVMLIASAVISQAARVAAEEKPETENTRSIGQSLNLVANIAILIGAVGSILFAGSKLLFTVATVGNLGLLAFQLVPIAAAYLLSKEIAWKRTFQVAAIATAVTAASVLISISALTTIQQIEVLALVAGLALVVSGFAGWSREEETRTEAVTLQLAFGSVLLVVPMIIGLVVYRVAGVDADSLWRYMHEIGGLLIGLSLLGSGVLCRIRSTTLAAASLLATYVITILFMINWPDQLQSTSVLMMIGGATFFAVALLLSLYRDWLLSLPAKIRRGDGIFRVLRWR